MRVEASVLIEAPIRAVFAFAANPCCWTEWMSGVSAIRTIYARTPDVGEIFDQENRSTGNCCWVRWEVVEYEPPRALCCRRINAVNPALLHLVLQSIDGATRLTTSIEGEAADLLISGLEAERAMTVQIADDLHRLRELLEDRLAEVNAEAPDPIGGHDAVA
jgi:hypothetical protein